MTLGLLGLGPLAPPFNYILQQVGFQSWQADDWETTLNFLTQSPAQAFLLGGQMEGLDDLAVCVQLRQSFDDSPPPLIQVVSQLEHLSGNYLLDMYRAGISDFLIWPAPTALIGHRLRQIMRYHDIARSLRESERRYQSLLRIIPDAFAQVDDQGIVQWSKADDLEQTPFVQGQSIQKLTPQQPNWFATACQQSCQEQLPQLGEGQQTNQSGLQEWALRLGENPGQGWWVWARNESQQRQMTTQLQYARYYDSLTGLPNYALFQEQFSWMLGLARFNRRGLGLVLLQPQHIRRRRREQGYKVTEQALRKWAIQISQQLHAKRRQEELTQAFLARCGEDLFGVLWPDLTHRGELDALADTLQRDNVLQIQSALAWTLEVSVASYPHDGDREEMLFDFALRNLEL